MQILLHRLVTTIKVYSSSSSHRSSLSRLGHWAQDLGIILEAVLQAMMVSKSEISQCSFSYFLNFPILCTYVPSLFHEGENNQHVQPSSMEPSQEGVRGASPAFQFLKPMVGGLLGSLLALAFLVAFVAFVGRH